MHATNQGRSSTSVTAQEISLYYPTVYLLHLLLIEPFVHVVKVSFKLGTSTANTHLMLIGNG